jgi:hypothetical protein
MISHPSPKTFRRGYKRTCYAARRHTTVSVGRPAAAVCHKTGPGSVAVSVWLIGYVSFKFELSPSIGAGELPVVALRAEIFAGWGRALATGCSKTRKSDCV